MEVNKFLKKRHLREFLSDKAKSLINKQETNQPTRATPASPPRQDRVINVISRGSKVSGVSHAAAKKSTRNSKNGQEITWPKCLLLGTNEIGSTAKEHERVWTPHHDALVISLTVSNLQVKQILVDNGSSSNLIFQAAYHDLGLEENSVTRKITDINQITLRSNFYSLK